jgi:hypothetical protein
MRVFTIRLFVQVILVFFNSLCSWRYIKPDTFDTQLVVPGLTYNFTYDTSFLNTRTHWFLFCSYCSGGTRSSWTSLRFNTQYFTRRDAFREGCVIELRYYRCVTSLSVQLQLDTSHPRKIPSDPLKRAVLFDTCVVSVSSLGRTIKALLLANGQERDRLMKHVRWNVSTASEFLPV